ncbi:MAG: CDP-diacylglycerol--serine O-phosphatidyltransferase [Planctomycetota bacterium]
MPRFGRLRSNSKPRHLLLGVHPIPTLVTLGNLLCGFAAIVLAMRCSNPPANFYNFNPNDCLRWASFLIFAAMIFDVMDGKIARWTKSASKFGMEMDSLADIISFGVAPAVLVKAMIDQELRIANSFPMLDRYIWPMLAIYVSCAALRLARYNVESQTGHRDFFFGIPSPGAAGCAASLVILILPGDHHVNIARLQEQMNALDEWRASIYTPVLYAMPFIMLALGVLMVSRVHYPHIGDILLRGRKSFMHVLVLGLGLVLIALHSEIILTLSFNGYLIFGLFNELRYQIFPSQRPSSWTEISITSDDTSPTPSGSATTSPDPPTS